MNRLLLGLNIMTLIVLVVFVNRYATEAAELRTFAYGDADVVPAAAIHVERADTRWKQRWVVHFGTDMVDASSVATDPTDPTGRPAVASDLVRLEPEAPVAMEWQSPRALAITPIKALNRATTYAVRLDDELRSKDGRKLPDDLELTFETNRPRLLALTVADGEGSAGEGAAADPRPILHARFDLPVAAGTLGEALQVFGGGKRLPVRVADTVTAGEHTLAIRFEGEDVLPAAVTVRLDGSLRARVGELSIGKDVNREVVLKEELRLLGVKTDERGVDLEFNRGVALPEEGFLTLRPAVPFQVVRRSSGLRLVADLKPGQATRVVLARGFPGRGPRRLSSEVTRTAWVRDLRPSFAFGDRGRVLSSRARSEIPIEGVNVQRLEVSVRSVYANNLVRLAQSSRSYDPPMSVFGPERKKVIVIAAPRNERFLERVDISDLLDGNARGVHRVVVRDADGHAYQQNRLIQVTDLGVTVRASEQAVAVHVSELAQGKDVARAMVEVLTPSNQLLCAGTTDANGVAVMPFEQGSDDMSPYLVKVTKGRDLAYVDVRQFGVELATDAFAGRARSQGVEAWMQGDRGAVRPGGTLRAFAVVRDVAGKSPAGATLRARWRDPSGVVQAAFDVEVPASGLLELEHATSGDAPTGSWRVELVADAGRPGSPSGTPGERVVGKTALRVDAFVPTRIEAEVLPVDELILGREGAVEVVGRWLEGTPASGLVAKVRVRFDHGNWRPAGFESYTFDAPSKGAPIGERPTIAAVLGDDGRARVRFAVPRESGATQTVRASISVELEDPSGRVVRAGLRRDVLRPDHHIGVAATRGGEVEVVALDRTGALADVKTPVTLTLEERYWDYQWKRRANGSYGYETKVVSQVIDSQELALRDGRARTRFDRPPEGHRWYAVVASCGGAESEARMSAPALRPDRLRVSGPGAPVKAGESFEIQIDSPIAGRAFVTVEGRTVLAHRVTSVAKGRTKVALSIPNDPIDPNVHVVVTVRRPQALRSGGTGAGPAWLVAGDAIDIDRSSRHLAVALDVPDQVRPKSRLAVAIDAPGATEAVVAVVDEGIIDLTGHREPDPFGWFTARRRCTSVGADNGRQLMMSARYEPGVLVGGGDGDGVGGGAARLRGTTSNLIETLVLARRVTLDAEGRASVMLRLPEYEGRVRVAVIACGARGMGAMTRDVKVSGPLGLRVAMPRMLAAADESRATVTVMNRTDAAGTCTLTVEPFGGIVPGTFPASLELTAGRTQNVEIPFVADDVHDAAGMKIVATMGSHRREVVGRVMVRPPALWAEDRFGVVVDGGKGTASVTVPDGWVGTVKARVIAHDQPDAALLPALESMLRYPYGCAEQTTSQCRALLACARMLPRFYDGAEAAEARSLLQTGIDRLLAMQNRRGGYGWWRGGEERAFLTIHVLDLFLDAKTAGVEVAAEPLRRLTDRAWSLLQGSSDGRVRSYGAEVLARAGRPAGPWIIRLAEVETGIEERSHLAMALARMGEKRLAIEVLERHPAAGGAIKPESRGMLRSALRARALELKARLVVTPGHTRIPILAQELSDALARPDRRTTQERGRAIDALARWFATQGAGAAFTNGVVEVSGKKHPIVPGKVLEIEVESGDVLKLSCEGNLWGMVDLRGYRGAAGAGSSSAGITLARAIIDVATGKEATEFHRGGLYEVFLSGSCDQALENIVLTDLLPGGFEPDVPNRPVRYQRTASLPDRIEARDDRVLLFFTGTIEREFEFTYRVRATFPGRYVNPPAALEALYEPGRRVELAGGEVVEVQ